MAVDAAVRRVDLMPGTDPFNWPRESPYRVWIAQEREHYIENCFRLGEPATDEGWRTWLEVMAFDYLQRAHHLLATARDPSGESVEAGNHAAEAMIADVNRYFVLDTSV